MWNNSYHAYDNFSFLSCPVLFPTLSAEEALFSLYTFPYVLNSQFSVVDSHFQLHSFCGAGL